MKRYFFSLVSIAFIIICVQNLAQNLDEPITVSPFIGEKLDRVERDYFKLFPHFDGFEEAVFYLNPDSTVSAHIFYKDSSIMKDTLIEKYKSLKTLTNYIDNAILTRIRDDQSLKASIILKDSSELEEHLFYANNQYIYTLNPQRNESQYTYQANTLLNNISITDIERIELIESVSTMDYVRYGSLIGIGVGIIAGAIYTQSNREKYKGWFGDLDKAADWTISIGIGAVVGSLSGLIIGLINQREDITFSPNSPEGLAKLKEYITYQE